MGSVCLTHLHTFSHAHMYYIHSTITTATTKILPIKIYNSQFPSVTKALIVYGKRFNNKKNVSTGCRKHTHTHTLFNSVNGNNSTWIHTRNLRLMYINPPLRTIWIHIWICKHTIETDRRLFNRENTGNASIENLTEYAYGCGRKSEKRLNKISAKIMAWYMAWYMACGKKWQVSIFHSLQIQTELTNYFVCFCITAR